MREMGFPIDYNTNWLFCTNWLALKTCIQVTLHRLNGLYLHGYIYTYNNGKKEAMNLKGRKEGYRRGIGKRK